MTDCESSLDDNSTGVEPKHSSVNPDKMSHFIAVGLAVFLIWMSQPGSSLFSWHPFFMTIAFVLLMFEAIMVFSKVSSLKPTALRQDKVRFHWTLQVMAIVCAVLGFSAIFYNKILFNKKHFTSLHSITGLVTMILVLLQATQGVSLLYPKLPVIREFKLGQLKQIHALLGALIFVCSTFTMIGGFNSNWFKERAENGRFLCIISMLSLGGIVVKQVKDAYGVGNKPPKK